MIKEFCESNGILHQLSVARTPQQNSVAEQRIIILKEATRTMISEAGLPKRFWVEVINMAYYTQK